MTMTQLWLIEEALARGAGIRAVAHRFHHSERTIKRIYDAQGVHPL